MSHFLADAQGILETACTAGGEDSDLAILVDREGSIRVVEAAGLPLDALQLHFGAQTAYRIRRTFSTVRVEGRAGSHSCLLEAKRLPHTAKRLLNSLALPSPLLPIVNLGKHADCEVKDLTRWRGLSVHCESDPHIFSSNRAYSVEAYMSK